ncbi:MAG: hypothetical protein WED10_11695 [Brumimicrobium sp.]
MRIFLTIWILISIAFIWFSYEPEQPDNFYDIEGLNEDIKAELDIDLLAIKKKADNVFSNDTTFYIDLIQEHYHMGANEYFERAGIPIDPVNSKGVRLNYLENVESSDSLGRSMMLSFAENIKLNDCDSLSQDSLCIYKLNWFNGIKKTNPHKQAMSYGTLHKPFVELMNSGLLSADETNYLILFLHYFGQLTSRKHLAK